MFLFLVFILTVNIFLIIGVLVTGPTPVNWGNTTVLYHTFGFFSLKFSDDSWGPMFQALNFLQSEHQKPVYSQIFFLKGIKFQYPLTSLLPVALIRIFLSELYTRGFVLFLSWIAVFATILISIRIFNFALSGEKDSDSRSSLSQSDLMVRAVSLFCFGITFYPVIKAFTLGQVQVFINFFFTLTVWLWLNNKFKISGFLVGLMILLKPQYAVICVWGLLRKKWGFSTTAIITVVTGLLISILVFGLSDNLDYLSVLSFISRHGEVFFANQSMNGLLNRLLSNGDGLAFDKNSFPSYNPIVYLGTVLSSFLLVSWGLLGFVRSDKEGNIFDFINVSLVCTVASPIAWEHHYGILMAIYSFLIPLLLKKPILGKYTVFYCIAVYFLASNILSFTTIFAYIPILNVLQSLLFFSALNTLLILGRIARYDGFYLPEVRPRL
jgi:alpha-1,2-mannosyltransferase